MTSVPPRRHRIPTGMRPPREYDDDDDDDVYRDEDRDSQDDQDEDLDSTGEEEFPLPRSTRGRQSFATLNDPNLEASFHEFESERKARNLTVLQRDYQEFQTELDRGQERSDVLVDQFATVEQIQLGLNKFETTLHETNEKLNLQRHKLRRATHRERSNDEQDPLPPQGLNLGSIGLLPAVTQPQQQQQQRQQQQPDATTVSFSAMLSTLTRISTKLDENRQTTRKALSTIQTEIQERISIENERLKFEHSKIYAMFHEWGKGYIGKISAASSSSTGGGKDPRKKKKNEKKGIEDNNSKKSTAATTKSKGGGSNKTLRGKGTRKSTGSTTVIAAASPRKKKVSRSKVGRGRERARQAVTSEEEGGGEEASDENSSSEDAAGIKKRKRRKTE